MVVRRSKGMTCFHIVHMGAHWLLPVSTTFAQSPLPISILDAHKVLLVSTIGIHEGIMSYERLMWKHLMPNKRLIRTGNGL